jgi:L-fucose isomerase-like protein
MSKANDHGSSRRQPRILPLAPRHQRPAGDYRALEAAGIKPIVLHPDVTAHGAVETYEDAKKCAALFKAHAAEIDGLIITLPNFGEERGLADAIRLADLRVPVLIQATPDAPSKMSIAFRRDSFCGKMSICNNLKQYGIPYSLTTLHTEAPDSPEFKADLRGSRRCAAWCAG